MFPVGALGRGSPLAGRRRAGLRRRPQSWCSRSGFPTCRCTCGSTRFRRLPLLLGSPRSASRSFAAGYFRAGEGTAPGLLCLQYHVFLASMALVLLADDAYAFMVAWETMALSSYFLVTTQHRIPEIRRAGFLYLLIAHVGAIAILLSFGVLQGGSWQFTFDAMRGADARTCLGERRLPPRPGRLRRQGGPGADARLAPRGASGRAVARLGADERGDAEDGGLRRPPGDASTCSTSPQWWWGAWRSRIGLVHGRCSAPSSPRSRPT